VFFSARFFRWPQTSRTRWERGVHSGRGSGKCRVGCGVRQGLTVRRAAGETRSLARGLRMGRMRRKRVSCLSATGRSRNEGQDRKNTMIRSRRLTTLKSQPRTKGHPQAGNDKLLHWQRRQRLVELYLPWQRVTYSTRSRSRVVRGGGGVRGRPLNEPLAPPVR
jgi:hypothetical protein